MRNYAFKDETVDESPLRLVDKPDRRHIIREIKSGSRIVAYTWTMTLAFASQLFVIKPMDDVFSFVLMAILVLRLISD